MRRTHDTEESIQRVQGEKSNFLLESRMCQAIGNVEEAIARFALAAPLEERIATYRDKTGEKELAARHRFSAASCWAKSGNLHDAIALFDALNRDPDTPGRLRVDALLFANRLREQQQALYNSYLQTTQAAV
jgi:hypothetical protein